MYLVLCVSPLLSELTISVNGFKGLLPEEEVVWQDGIRLSQYDIIASPLGRRCRYPRSADSWAGTWAPASRRPTCGPTTATIRHCRASRAPSCQSRRTSSIRATPPTGGPAQRQGCWQAARAAAGLVQTEGGRAGQGIVLPHTIHTGRGDYGPESESGSNKNMQEQETQSYRFNRWTLALPIYI